MQAATGNNRVTVHLAGFVVVFYAQGGSDVRFDDGLCAVGIVDNEIVNAIHRRAFRFAKRGGLVRSAVRGECGCCRLV